MSFNQQLFKNYNYDKTICIGMMSNTPKFTKYKESFVFGYCETQQEQQENNDDDGDGDDSDESEPRVVERRTRWVRQKEIQQEQVDTTSSSSNEDESETVGMFYGATKENKKIITSTLEPRGLFYDDMFADPHIVHDNEILINQRCRLFSNGHDEDDNLWW